MFGVGGLSSVNHLRSTIGFLLIAVTLLAGCGKPATPPPDATPTAQPSTPVLRFHWLGKKRLATEANATNFMAIWNLPESAKLEAQTLAKLATAPWRLWQTNVAVSKAPTALLRPLLDDLVQEEVYLEAIGGPNQPSELVFAIRLPADRAALWETNLPVVLNSLSAPHQPSTLNPQLTLTRSNNWTLLSFTPSPLRGEGRGEVSQTNKPVLLNQFLSRLATSPNPYSPRATNHWVELEAGVGTLLTWMGGSKALDRIIILKTNSPQLALRVIGEAGNVRTTGDLHFPAPVPVEMEAWNLPTNVIHDPLSGFMAIRGFRPWLNVLGWNESQLGDVPNQIYFWAQAGTAPLHFFAFPSQTASNQIVLLGDYILKNVNPKMASSATVQNTPLGSFERVENSPNLRWRGLPLLTPNVNLAMNDGNGFVTGGLFGNRITNRPAPDSLLQQFRTESNLVLYDWELSQPSTYRFIQASQFGRFIFGRARLSMTNNAALPWVVAVSSRLGTSGSSLRLSDPTRLSFSRSSTIGLTGAEIHLLVDWLEAPDFPLGLYTLDAKPQSPMPPGMNQSP